MPKSPSETTVWMKTKRGTCLALPSLDYGEIESETKQRVRWHVGANVFLRLESGSRKQNSLDKVNP